MTLLVDALVLAVFGGAGALAYFKRKKPVTDPTVEPRVVSAVMSAVNIGSMEGERSHVLHKVLEDAEVQAVLDCMAEGVDLHDGPTIIARKREYRALAMEKFNGN